MAGIRYLDLITDVETITNVTGQRAMVRRLVNNAVARIGSVWDWPYLWKWSFLTTVASVTAGKVAVTNGSQTVTGTGTAFTAAMVGRKIRISSDNAYYTIQSIAAQVITLDQVYSGSTSTSTTYTIYQDEYYLNADVDQYKLLRQMTNSVVLISKNISDFDIAIPTPSSLSNATFEALIGRAVKTYTTGTVTLASGSRTLTGVSTSWTSALGVSIGSKVQIGTALFTVKSVDSDTQLTLYEAATASVAAGSAYTIVTDNLTVQLYQIPNTQENYYYRYQRIPAVLDADQDYPDLPPTMHPLIIQEVIPWIWEHKGFPDRARQSRKSYQEDLQKAILHYGYSNPDRVIRRKSADVSTLGIQGPSLPSNLGVPSTF